VGGHAPGGDDAKRHHLRPRHRREGQQPDRHDDADDRADHDRHNELYPPGNDKAAAHDHGRAHDEPHHHETAHDHDEPHDGPHDDRGDDDDSDDRNDRHLDDRGDRDDDER
jgi:hypothetical protein